MTSQNIRVKNLVMAALFTAIGVVLPQSFHMIPNAGSIILPMHIPVLICGMTVGGFYGAIAGALTVSLSILINGMPPLFPTGVCMIVELAVYSLVSGVAYKALGCRMNRKRTYAALIIAMLAGRAANGLAMTAAMGMAGKAYTLQAFLTAAFVTALPGIIIQLVLIPPVVMALEKTHLTANA